MASLGGIHGSEVMNNEIFKERPLACKLQQDIDAILLQFSPERKCSPKIQETIGRISSLSEIIASTAGETRADLVNLYMETVRTNRLSECSDKFAVLESHQQNRVASILGASNDANFSQAA